MTVHSLAVWHSYLGLHAKWVLGVRHDKERGARKRKKRCSQDGCDNQVVQGCKQHGASVKLCIQEGCDNQVVQGGVCIKYGARVKRKKLCSLDGCYKQVQQGGVCIKHGAKRRS
jgi:hypothetical protein